MPLSTAALRDAIAWRRDFLRRSGGCFTLGERLSHAMPRLGGAPRDPDALFLRRLRTAPDGARYFEIGGDRIFFAPGHEAAEEEAVLRGALTILREVYLDGTGFFSPRVDLRPGDVALDLGGNLGTSAIAFARKVGPGGRVWSFEPVFGAPLRRNLAENGVAAAVEVAEVAVGEAPGEMDFYVSDIGIDSRLSRRPRAGERRTVRVTSLDRFAAEAGLGRVDFVKVDIEGAEELAIRGALDVVRRFRPKWSVASYHTDLEGDRQHPKLVRLLRELGYTVDEVGDRHIYAH